MKNAWKLLWIVIIASLLVACGSGADTTEDAGGPAVENEEESAAEETAEEADYPLTLTDAAGNEVTLEEEPERIVSLIPSNTEITFALGQGDKVVGVSDHDNYPEEVLDIEKIGGMEINTEVIIALEPDLVLAHELGVSSAQEALDQLEGSGINVFVVQDAQDIATTYETIETIGQVIGAPEEAETIVNEMEAGFQEVEELTSQVDEADRQSVFFENSPSPDIYTAGQNTFIQELLDIINADNAAGNEEGWVAMDPEAIIELNPDVIITTYGGYIDNPEEEVMSRDGFDAVNAVANERVYDVDTDVVSRSGPRLVEGAKVMAEVVYPELFDEE
jgi:iron complex transport system substrate-binding protein